MFLDPEETTRSRTHTQIKFLKTLTGTLKLQSTIDDLTKKWGYGAGMCAEWLMRVMCRIRSGEMAGMCRQVDNGRLCADGRGYWQLGMRNVSGGNMSTAWLHPVHFTFRLEWMCPRCAFTFQISSLSCGTQKREWSLIRLNTNGSSNKSFFSLMLLQICWRWNASHYDITVRFSVQ